jgi:hypothetical protein
LEENKTTDDNSSATDSSDNSTDASNSTDTNNTNSSNSKESFEKMNEKAREEAYSELPHEIPKGIRFLNITHRFGNIYINIVNRPHSAVSLNDTILHGVSYANHTVDFGMFSKKNLMQHLKMA